MAEVKTSISDHNRFKVIYKPIYIYIYIYIYIIMYVYIKYEDINIVMADIILLNQEQGIGLNLYYTGDQTGPPA